MNVHGSRCSVKATIVPRDVNVVAGRPAWPPANQWPGERGSNAAWCTRHYQIGLHGVSTSRCAGTPWTCAWAPLNSALRRGFEHGSPATRRRGKCSPSERTRGPRHRAADNPQTCKLAVPPVSQRRIRPQGLATGRFFRVVGRADRTAIFTADRPLQKPEVSAVRDSHGKMVTAQNTPRFQLAASPKNFVVRGSGRRRLQW
jgi:hypothetical protein